MGKATYPTWMYEAFEKAGKTPRFVTARELDKCDILYGSFGTHGKEPPEEIIFRKLKEIDKNKKGKFSLWGGRISSIDNVKDFCGKIAASENPNSPNPVYVLLRYTGHTPDVGDVPYNDFWFENDWKPLSDYNIEVLGSENTRKDQDRAFVVEEYCLFECSVSFNGTGDLTKDIYTCYSKTKLYNENRSDMISPQESVVLLERKKNGSGLDSMPEGEKNFALVLKLMSPYVVDLKR